MRAQEIRAALDRHWIASDANDFETEHDIYLEDAVLEYPQSGERIRGRRNIQITRNTAGQPAADIDLDWIFAYQPLPAFTSRECMRDIDPVYAPPLPLDLDQRRY